MDAIDLASEIKRARNVAARHAAYATNGDGAEWDDPQMVAHMWQQSAARHAARAEYLTRQAKGSTDPELPRYLKLFGVTL